MVQISSICIHYVLHMMCEPCFQWFDLKNEYKIVQTDASQTGWGGILLAVTLKVLFSI